MKCLPILAIFIGVVPLTVAQPRYEIVSLEAYSAPANEGVFARGINQSGQVMGSYWTPGQTELRLFTYSLGTGMADLGPAPATFMYARGINDAGQLVAYGSAERAWRYTPGVGYESVGGNDDAEGLGINNRGQVTGWATVDGVSRVFRHTDGVGFEDLGQGRGWGINDSGAITGDSQGNVILYQDGIGMTVLFPGVGRAINNHGTIAGETFLTGSEQAFLYANGSFRFLESFGGPSQVWGLNNDNEVVGNTRIGEQVRAFLWREQNGMQDLNDLLPPDSGWTLSGAFGINDAGQIVGDGSFNGRSTAFLLNPVPEPSTWALLLLGTGALFFLRRRKA